MGKNEREFKLIFNVEEKNPNGMANIKKQLTSLGRQFKPFREGLKVNIVEGPNFQKNIAAIQEKLDSIKDVALDLNVSGNLQIDRVTSPITIGNVTSELTIMNANGIKIGDNNNIKIESGAFSGLKKESLESVLNITKQISAVMKEAADFSSGNTTAQKGTKTKSGGASVPVGIDYEESKTKIISEIEKLAKEVRKTVQSREINYVYVPVRAKLDSNQDFEATVFEPLRNKISELKESSPIKIRPTIDVVEDSEIQDAIKKTSEKVWNLRRQGDAGIVRLPTGLRKIEAPEISAQITGINNLIQKEIKDAIVINTDLVLGNEKGGIKVLFNEESIKEELDYVCGLAIRTYNKNLEAGENNPDLINLKFSVSEEQFKTDIANSISQMKEPPKVNVGFVPSKEAFTVLEEQIAEKKKTVKVPVHLVLGEKKDGLKVNFDEKQIKKELDDVCGLAIRTYNEGKKKKSTDYIRLDFEAKTQKIIERVNEAIAGIKKAPKVKVDVDPVLGVEKGGIKLYFNEAHIKKELEDVCDLTIRTYNAAKDGAHELINVSINSARLTEEVKTATGAAIRAYDDNSKGEHEELKVGVDSTHLIKEVDDAAGIAIRAFNETEKKPTDLIKLNINSNADVRIGAVGDSIRDATYQLAYFQDGINSFSADAIQALTPVKTIVNEITKSLREVSSYKINVNHRLQKSGTKSSAEKQERTTTERNKEAEKILRENERKVERLQNVFAGLEEKFTRINERAAGLGNIPGLQSTAEMVSRISQALESVDLRSKGGVNEIAQDMERLKSAISDVTSNVKTAEKEAERATRNTTTNLDHLKKYIGRIIDSDPLRRVTEGNLQKNFVGTEDELQRIQKLRDAIIQFGEAVAGMDQEIDKASFDRLKNQFDNLYGDLQRLTKQTFKAKPGVGFNAISEDDLRNIENAYNRIREMNGISQNINIQWSDKATGDMHRLTGEFIDQDGAIKTLVYDYNSLTGGLQQISSAEKATIPFVERITRLFKQRGEALIAYLGTFASFYRVMAEVRKGIEIVALLDANMTELRRVSGATRKELELFKDTVFETGREIGSTGDNIIKLAADYARLGYSLNEAKELASASAMYMNVGFIEDANFAMESLTSTMKAYGMEASQVTEIVDKFNEVGNSFAISSEGIGEALIRSAAALSQANNDLDKSIALVVAANNVVQDPQVVGTALRTVSMRIRTAKSDMESLGEETDGMADSVSSLRKEILALSGVDIMVDDTKFKDTYEIMRELAYVWNDLTDVSQAALLERIAGKRGANAVASILSNVKDLESALETSRNSTGSALAENQKYLESIQGRISQLQATWQEFWDASPIQDVSKALISLLDGFIQIVNEAGGLNSVLTFVFSSALLTNITKITDRFSRMAESISGIGGALRDFNGVLNRSGISKGQFVLDALFRRNSFSSNAATDNFTRDISDSIARVFNSSLRTSGGSGAAAEAAAINELNRYTAFLNETQRERIRVELQRAAATNQGITADRLAASTTQLVTREQAAGTRQAQAYAAAQRAIGTVMLMVVAAAITAVINKYREYKKEQEEARQGLIENAKNQMQQADALRDAANNFEKINAAYKRGGSSADKYKDSIAKVNEALGDQIYMLAGLIEGSDEWWARVKQIMKDQDEAAKRAANMALQQSAELSPSDKAKNKAKTNALATGGVAGTIATAGAVAVPALIGAAPFTMGTTAAIGAGVAAIVGIASYFADVASNTYTADEALTKYINDTKKLEDLNKKQTEIQKEQGGILEGTDLWVKKQKEFDSITEEMKQVRAGLIELEEQGVNDIIENAGKAVSYGITDVVDDIVEVRKRLEPEIKKAMAVAGLGADAYEVVYAEVKKLHPELITQIENADAVISKYRVIKGSSDDLLKELNNVELGQLNSGEFDKYIEQEKIIIRTTEQAIKAFRDWSAEEEEKERQSNRLTEVVGESKEAIDGFQESISKLSSILKADYSGNASGMIDDLQELIEVLGAMDEKDAEKFFNKLNNSFSAASLGDAMKSVSADVIKKQTDDLIKSFNLANPALEETIRLFVQQQQQIEAVTAELDSFKSSYQSLTSIVKDYNENGFLTADNISAILEMSPEYLSALSYEGGQLKLNEEALRDIAIARIQEARLKAEENRQTRLNAIYAEQEARSKGMATEMTLEHAEAMLKEAIAAGESEFYIRKLEQQVAKLYEQKARLNGQKYDGTLDSDLAEQERAVNETYDAIGDTYDRLEEDLKSGSREMLATHLGVTDEVEESAKDAANELKSQIDSVLSKWKSALDSGAINYKQYLDKMKAMRDKYADQLSQEDLLQMDVDIAQTEVDMWKEAGDALGRQIDRTMIKPLQDRIEGLNKEREALQKNKDATSAYYDEIIGGLEDQKQAIDDNIKAVEKSYEAQIKPLEAQQKAINKQIKAIEKEKRVIEDQIKLLERSKRPYEHQQKAIQKEIRAIEKEIKVLEKSKKPYEQKQKAIDKEIKAIEREVRALERTKKPYEQQQKAIEKEIKAVEKQIKALEKTKKPYEEQKKAIDKQVKAIQNQIKAIEDSKRPY